MQPSRPSDDPYELACTRPHSPRLHCSQPTTQDSASSPDVPLRTTIKLVSKQALSKSKLMLIGPTSGATRLRRLGRERTRAVLGGADGSVSPRFCRHANRRELLVPLLACAIYLAHGLQWSYFPPFLPEVLLFLAVKHLRQLSIGPLAVAFGVLRAVGASSLLVQGQVTFVTSCIPVFMLHVLMAEKHFPLVMELSVLLLLLSSNVMEPLLSIAWHQPASIIGSSLAGLLVGAVSRYYVIATLEMQERLVANEATIKYLRGKVFEQCIDVMALLENTSRPQSPTATYMDPLEPHAAYISRALQNVTKAYDWCGLPTRERAPSK